MEIRDVLLGAVREIGGMERLVAWIKESPHNEHAFWVTMFMKLVPVKVEGQGPHGEIELSVAIKPDDLAKRLEERGLPGFVFGVDRPVLELEAREGNGSRNGSVSDDATEPGTDDSR